MQQLRLLLLWTKHAIASPDKTNIGLNPPDTKSFLKLMSIFLLFLLVCLFFCLGFCFCFALQCILRLIGLSRISYLAEYLHGLIYVATECIDVSIGNWRSLWWDCVKDRKSDQFQTSEMFTELINNMHCQQLVLNHYETFSLHMPTISPYETSTNFYCDCEYTTPQN